MRLQQGDYDRETVFGENAVAMAQQWAAAGASRLHLVDLDGARDGQPRNLSVVAAILKAVNLTCELGGGIRSEQTIRELLDMGLCRLVIGTLAIRQPDWFRSVCRQFPQRLVLGIDARDGKVATHGWLQTSEMAATELAKQFNNEPIAAIIYTDIATDGMMAGPNVAALAEMQAAIDLPVIASGGVTTMVDVVRLALMGMAGCIIGRALYEGTITLPDALAAAGPIPK